MQFSQIGLIGYGEVGKTFALGLLEKPGVTQVSAWDLKFEASTPWGVQEAEKAHASQHNIQAVGAMAALCAQSQFIISAVTASNTLSVAQQAAQSIGQAPGSLV